MYQAHFSLEQRPFCSAPRAEAYFSADSIENSRQSLQRAISGDAGPCLIVGPAGVGKTMLCHVLADEFKKKYRVALLTCSRMSTRRGLLQSILFELGLPYRGMEESELRLTLVDHLEPSDRCPKGLLLFVDEAHHLSVRLLEELRLLTNLIRDGQSRVRVVLAGGPALEERFASPKLESFNQRIAARCYLDSLNRSETIKYIRRQVEIAGGDPAVIFNESALLAVYDATGGIPRLINQLCDHAMLSASLAGKRKLDRDLIDEAWSDLQRLPTPWSDNSQTLNTDSSVVEFGHFDDNTVIESESHPADSSDDQSEFQNNLAGVVAQLDSPPSPAMKFKNLSITDNYDAVSNHDAVESRLDSGAFQPEIELFFHPAHDPTVERFEEEEVVIDQFGCLEDGALSGCVRVRNLKDGGFSAGIPNRSYRPFDFHPTSPAAVDNAKFQVVGDDFERIVKDAAVDDADVADNRNSGAKFIVEEELIPFGGVLSEDYILEYAENSSDANPTIQPKSEVGERSESTDDRDLIVIDEESPSFQPVDGGQTRPREYRQLFSQLRTRT